MANFNFKLVKDKIDFVENPKFDQNEHEKKCLYLKDLGVISQEEFDLMKNDEKIEKTIKIVYSHYKGNEP